MNIGMGIIEMAEINLQHIDLAGWAGVFACKILSGWAICLSGWASSRNEELLEILFLSTF